MPCDWSKTPYSSFDDCVAQNQGKGDPGAYCAFIMRQIGGEELEVLGHLAFYRQPKGEGHHDMANLCGTCNWSVCDPKEVLQICPSCGAKAFYVPVLHTPYEIEGFAGTMRHRDFARIHGEFVKYYCKDQPMCTAADDEYYAWLKGYNLDETGPYGAAQEAFRFVKDMIQRWKEDAKNVFYKVLVAFPVTSMNGNVYEKGDLIAMAHSLVGPPVNMNHKRTLELPGVEYVASQFEDGAVEAVLKVPKSTICPVCEERNKPLYQMIDEKRILNVSLEGEGRPFRFTGCALLTTDVLPGIPMARIFPMERYLSEAFSAPKTLKVKTRRIEISGISMTPPKREQETPTCPEGQHFDAEAGKCVPGSQGPPSGAQVTVGTGAAPDTTSKPVGEASAYLNPDGTFIGGFEGCVKYMQAEKGLPEENARKLCAFIGRKAGKIASYVNVLTDALKEGIVTMGDNTLELSTLRVDKRKLELKVSGLDTRLLETEKSLTEESQNHLKAEGRIIELEKQLHKAENSMVESNKDKVKDDVIIKEWQRRNQDIGDAHGKLKTDHEALVLSHTALDAKYREALKQNLDLSGRLTSANEQHLAAMNKVTELEEKLAKARRLGKIIVKQ